MTRAVLVGWSLVACCAVAWSAAWADAWPQYDANPFVIKLDIPAPSESEGGIVAAPLTGGPGMDYLVTVKGHVAAYSNAGDRLWIHEVDLRVGGSSEREGLPGHNGPGVAAGDIDGDGAVEVLYLTNDGVLHVVDGATGAPKWTAQPPAPEGAERWEHLVIVNLRGEGDRDLVLQATNRDGYRTGRYVSAFELARLREGDLAPLWAMDDFGACAHNGVRAADLDGDGRDELLGANVVDADGRTLARSPLRGHVDSVFVQDVLPDRPGLEVVLLEEGGGNRVFLLGKDEFLWETHYEHWEPQNAAVGRFDPDRPGLEVWCRSRFDTDQKPFVFAANGDLVRQYELNDTAPEGWTRSGVELIYTIDWTGEEGQLAAATERHTTGDICVFHPITGEFVQVFDEEAHRLYVADVSGDWREEMIVLHGNELRIYHNPAPNPRPDQPRLWELPHYRRAKQAYNYYSP